MVQAGFRTGKRVIFSLQFRCFSTQLDHVRIGPSTVMLAILYGSCLVLLIRVRVLQGVGPQSDRDVTGQEVSTGLMMQPARGTRADVMEYLKRTK